MLPSGNRFTADVYPVSNATCVQMLPMRPRPRRKQERERRSLTTTTLLNLCSIRNELFRCY